MQYPVISVDGWVNIIEPVSGMSCGEIHALVAVGTADQIALLEMSRGLRDSTVSPRTLHDRTLSQQEASTSESTRNQECQTDLPSTEEMNCEHERVLRHSSDEETSNFKQSQDAQTDMSDPVSELLPSRSQVLLSSDESSVECPVDNFQISSAMFRSVGVGAEFNEETSNAVQSTNLPGQEFSSNDQSEMEDTDDDGESFRAVVEIKRAYHLPLLDPFSGLEPSTYVSFETAKTIGHQNITNVCSKSCSPVWDWKCNTSLSKDLVYNVSKWTKIAFSLNRC